MRVVEAAAREHVPETLALHDAPRAAGCAESPSSRENAGNSSVASTTRSTQVIGNLSQRRKRAEREQARKQIDGEERRDAGVDDPEPRQILNELADDEEADDQEIEREQHALKAHSALRVPIIERPHARAERDLMGFVALHRGEERGGFRVFAGFLRRHVFAELHPVDAALDAVLDDDRRARSDRRASRWSRRSAPPAVVAERKRRAAIAAIGALGEIGAGEEAGLALGPGEIRSSARRRAPRTVRRWRAGTCGNGRHERSAAPHRAHSAPCRTGSRLWRLAF